MAPLPQSVRQTIISNIYTAFEAAQVSTPAGNVPFSTIAIGPLADEDRRKRFAIGIVPGRDNTTYETSFIRHDMALDIEFSVAVQSSDQGSQFVSAALMAETLLTAVQLVILQDITWGGYAIDTHIVGAETGVRVYAARSLLGVCNTIVSYRHNVIDPRDPAPGIG